MYFIISIDYIKSDFLLSELLYIHLAFLLVFNIFSKTQFLYAITVYCKVSFHLSVWLFLQIYKYIYITYVSCQYFFREKVSFTPLLTQPVLSLVFQISYVFFAFILGFLLLFTRKSYSGYYFIDLKVQYRLGSQSFSYQFCYICLALF